MRRWLLRLTAILSLILCLAFCAAWIRTRMSWHTGGLEHCCDDSILRRAWDPERGVRTVAFVHWDSGRLEVRGWRYFPPLRSPDYEGPTPSVRWSVTHSEHAVGGGLDFRWFESQWEPDAWRFGAELWLLIAMTAVPPLLWLVISFRRRPRPGHCPSCGYDLRATPDRCPECGAVAASITTSV